MTTMSGPYLVLESGFEPEFPESQSGVMSPYTTLASKHNIASADPSRLESKKRELRIHF